jgi:hypothetical protein
VSKRTIELVAGLIRGRRKQLGTRWRKVTPGTQAIVVLALLRHDQRLLDMADGNDVSASTVRRWVLEVLGLLAARAPRLGRALKKIARRGGAVVLLDGTLVRTRRRTGADNRKNAAGNAGGLLFLALTDEKGDLIWISSARPGRVSEITAARHDHITRHLREAGLGALADLGFVRLDDDPDGAPVIITGRKATRSGQEHATLRAGFPLDATRTTDLLERPLPDQRADLPVNGEQNLSLTPRPFQIRTLRLTPAP